jgi:RimJ/RimL family protein N-acetyltransferase
MFLPAWWGNGYATEAVAAVLEWAATYLPGEPIVLCTQTANEASVRLARRLGFREVGRFVEFEAEQWFGVRD